MVKNENVITPARWYEQQAELARAQEAALEGAMALAGLIGVAQGVLAAFGQGRFERLRTLIADAEDAMRRLSAFAGGQRLPAAEPLRQPETVDDLPAALRREGGL